MEGPTETTVRLGPQWTRMEAPTETTERLGPQWNGMDEALLLSMAQCHSFP
jgi:hypothetical protein